MPEVSPRDAPLRRQRQKARIDYRRVQDLSPSEWNALWSLISPFVEAPREAFERGLRAMDEVWLYSVGGALRGFGGVWLFHPKWQGRTSCVIFTGRVYLHADSRGRNIIQRVGLHYYLREVRLHPRRTIYWMFGAGTFKSYLLLSRNFREYWPRPGAALPPRERALYEAFATELNNPAFDPLTGILSDPELVYLDGNIGLDAEALSDPDVAFYARTNPGQVKGDGVVCLAPLTLSNWASIIFRMAARSVRRMVRGTASPRGTGLR